MKTLSLLVTLLVAASAPPAGAQSPFAASGEGSSAPGFVKGADLSLLQFIESHGGQYREAGQTRDPLAIFRNHGCNYVRLRLFVHPDGTAGQVNSLPYTLALAKRAKQAGFRWLLDLHYSDGWADPGHQSIPAEWKGLSPTELTERVYTYTKETVAAFALAGCLPDMVQVGNEITNGMMWPAGGPLKKPADFDAFADLLKAGIRGVRENGSADTIPVMVHVDKGGNKEVSKWFFDNCRQRGVPFEIIGLSYYPLLHGSLDDLRDNLAALSRTYQKDIIVAETDYNAAGSSRKPAPFAFTPEGQQAFLEALVRVVAATPDGHGKGFFYWAPEWIMGGRWDAPKGSGQWEDRALFDPSGNMLPAMGAYQLNPLTAR